MSASTVSKLPVVEIKAGQRFMLNGRRHLVEKDALVIGRSVMVRTTWGTVFFGFDEEIVTF